MAQRAFDAQLGDGLQAGAVVAVIVEIGALGDAGKAARVGNGPDFCEQLALAEIAAIFRVFAEPLDLQLLRAADDMGDSLALA